jgi:hypothetical protein
VNGAGVLAEGLVYKKKLGRVINCRGRQDSLAIQPISTAARGTSRLQDGVVFSHIKQRHAQRRSAHLRRCNFAAHNLSSALFDFRSSHP